MDLTFFCNNKICPICGYMGLEGMPYSEENGIFYGNHIICSCCGFQFGFHDDPREQRQNLMKKWQFNWIKSGCKWWSPNPLPMDWNPGEQLKNINIFI